MAPKVHLMPPARRKLHPDLHELVPRELASIFSKTKEVIVYDVLLGFPSSQHVKVILAVETCSRDRRTSTDVFARHIVKLGRASHVAADALGWQACVRGRQMSSRMFVGVHLHELAGADGRAAVVYQDAGQWYGLLDPQDEVGMLGWAVDRAVFSAEISITSVQRVIRQVCRELGRSFYIGARDDAHAARTFYRSKLKLQTPSPVLDRWQNGESWHTRRHVDWMLCGAVSPATTNAPNYLDPYDYIRWVLALGDATRLPPTLVGPSHGDLHANNVIVGVVDGEIEYPLLIDYGDMALENVVAWDFAKLETELKVRLLAKLYGDPSARDTLWKQTPDQHMQELLQHWSHCDPDGKDPLVNRLRQALFAYEFERQLDERTAHIYRSPPQAPLDPPAARTQLERALAVLTTIRAQAAEHLSRGGRVAQWQDELKFALTVYGLNTIKFDDESYPEYQRMFALISAGTAAARLSSVPSMMNEAVTVPGPADGWPTYHMPLRAAYRLWQANKQHLMADQFLTSVSEQYAYSVVILRERALLQSKVGKLPEAEATIESIADLDRGPHDRDVPALVALCGKFLDIEVLSRFGRINKDKADASWEESAVDFQDLTNRPAAQYYRSAYEAYHKAFELNGHYYPGGNAAVTGLLASIPKVHDIAKQVAEACAAMGPGSLSRDDRYWVLATEGDMSLILGEREKAADFFRCALTELPEGYDGMVQSSYNQICRLYRALGAEVVRPALEVFRQTKKFKLKGGPLGDCGGAFAPRAE